MDSDKKELILNFIKNKSIIVYVTIGIIIISLISVYFVIRGMFNDDMGSGFNGEEYELMSMGDNSSEIDNNINKSINEDDRKEEIDGIIKVYVTGEVNNPGVIELIDGERIEDAINKVGGITQNACLDKVNLAYRLEDGQKVYIPNTKDIDESEIVSTENGQNVINDNPNNTSKSSSKNGKININSADIEKLCEIPGIGESLAQRIIEYRNDKGKFKSIEDLKNVSGIGDKKFEAIKNLIEVK